jgi:6-phospho 3-hexuloisomerase
LSLVLGLQSLRVPRYDLVAKAAATSIFEPIETLHTHSRTSQRSILRRAEHKSQANTRSSTQASAADTREPEDEDRTRDRETKLERQAEVAEMDSGELAARVCRRIADVFAAPVDGSPALGVLVDELGAVGRRGGLVFLWGVGREGLMLRALCMRLCHLGVRAHCVLDMGVPPCSPDDLLIASDGPGGHATVRAVCERAHSAGGRVLLLTGRSDAAAASAAPFASLLVRVPAQTMADDRPAGGDDAAQLLPMGSLYEGALFVLFEMVVYRLAAVLGQSASQIRARHTNLE